MFDGKKWVKRQIIHPDSGRVIAEVLEQKPKVRADRGPSYKSPKSIRRRRHYHKQQNGGCWLCKEPMMLTENLTYLSVTLDHVEPISIRKKRGAIDSGDNLKAAHWLCNMIRGNKQEMTSVSQEQKIAFIKKMRKRARQEMGIPDDFCA